MTTNPEETGFRYDAGLAEKIEKSWQHTWEQAGTFHAPNPTGDLSQAGAGLGLQDVDSSYGPPKNLGERESLYIMDMFPYPSGAGLHVGHPLGYLGTDVYGRYQRMRGHNVMHALSYDAFGLPADLYAVQTGQHPRITTDANITNMTRQLRRLGLAHDARRSFATTDDDFVRWTQWIFLQIFNSWYDPEASTAGENSRGAARPIGTLIDQFAQGTRQTPDGRPWTQLSPAEQEDVLQGYRLAYVSESPVNWCPGLGTVLANEEVTAEGLSERGNFPVYTRRLRQWNMRITAYADRLIDDLDSLDWPSAVRSMQTNWIGRSKGALLRLPVAASETQVEVYTTRPDTLFGATYLVLSPEHPQVEQLTAAQWDEQTPEGWRGGESTPAEAISAYQRNAAAKTDADRQQSKDKTGIFTGSFAVNPATGEQIPIFIADYVLMGYGTGAIMAVPAEDARDWDFAKSFGLPYVRTVQPPADHDEDTPFTGTGVMINSANDEIDINGLDVEAAKAKITAWLADQGLATESTQYRLRDWLFSRQRYWGEPFPIVYNEAGTPIALPDSMLPVELPEVDEFAPRTFAADDADSEPEPALGRNRDWVEVELDLGDGPQKYYRETNTMPNWAGSSWYQLRYADPHNSERLVDPENEQYWLGPRESKPRGGADLYVGGAEHSVLHLLYSRFWHKILFDLGHVSSSEPFHRLVNQGYIQAYAYTDARGVYVPAAEVEETVADNGESTFWYDGEQVNREYGKIGKSLKNSVSPDEMYDAYGADTFRVYEMSMGPIEQARPWETRAVVGAQRFLQRVWRLFVDETTGESVIKDGVADPETLKVLHQVIDGVREDMDHLRFNTAISKLIVLTNHATKQGGVTADVLEPLTIMLSPFAPHLGEELWAKLGHTSTLTYASFPEVDLQYLVADQVTCVVQVKGKVRARLEVDPDISAEELEKLALESPNALKALDGAGVRKVIVRAPKLVNIVPDA
ncbi:leucine--tRNA ligase [Brevibacterium aurantiacum]|uniref:Leucine--tRNA ligase n=1 Tax=Brevibacterium aurantiacum TaxID=273384 RepID=A0A2H1I235_BREAU|nr:leucine--tRNA ligase [Brevibacterium aurantiacum]AZL06069.1 leucine--tRNA ligase [Brevibacterium aurantiacum]AZL09627.1 leucine--tRNA ligase [Brevibacterium aurantiacum]AZT93758.1 leucine--tRNA ligase [Brevibacterium aurantiacum]RCS95957.1 leucine--tRNA ligase [Brevibacterium aurantiacum]SMX63079.1 leucyl-tRNA synthetase [Brevibacterium aurantiacum]